MLVVINDYRWVNSTTLNYLAGCVANLSIYSPNMHPGVSCRIRLQLLTLHPTCLGMDGSSHKKYAYPRIMVRYIRNEKNRYNLKLNFMITSFIRTTLHPALYHGSGKRSPFFEGWYYKLVSQDEKLRYAIIPGVILGEKGHAFIQILDGVNGASSYHPFPIEAFWASFDDFDIHIGKSHFTADTISLDIQDDFNQLNGELHFQGGSPWPVSLLSPGIMGWYAWMPRMECYHGVLSFDHTISGGLQVNGKKLDFSDGRGYIEKDWGQSFPAAWVWFQSNHFQHIGTCLTASVAIIPWMRTSFPGFIIGFWNEHKLIRFATYTGAKIDTLVIGEHSVEWIVHDRQYRLEMYAQQAPGGMLLGPTKVEMGKRVDETLNASVYLRLSLITGTVLFEGTGKYAGLEVNGDLRGLQDKSNK
jgi:tocopherol cyclase